LDNLYGIYGASGHAKVIIEIIENCGGSIKELYDDDANKTILLGYSVSNNKKKFQEPRLNWIIAIGNNKIRKKITENKLNYGFAIDRSANISRTAILGKGTVVMPGVCINSCCIIGAHAIINTSACVDHECIVGDYVHISPNATICGGVNVGEGSHIGAGAVVIPGINIGKWTTIGAGSVIIKDVPDFATVVGNPGQIIKVKEHGR
jgi:acetyltransferase EpsM